MGLVWVLVEKDVREVLRSRHFIVSVLASVAMLALMGFVLDAFAGAAEGPKEAGDFAVVVAGNATEAGRAVAEALREAGGTAYGRFDPDLLARYRYVVVVPQNFSFPGRLEVHAELRGLSSWAYVEEVRRAALKAAERFGVPRSPVEVAAVAYLGGRALRGDPMGLATAAVLTAALALVLVSMVVGVVALSMGIEKEKRMLELILSTPATPRHVLAAKVLSSLLTAALLVAAFAAGYLLMLRPLLSAPTPAPEGGVLLAASFVQFLPWAAAATAPLAIAAAALAVLAGVRAEDVKTAQAVVPLVAFPFFLPALVLPYMPVDPLALAWLPPAHPYVVPLLAAVGYSPWPYLALDWALAAGVALLATWSLTPEKVVAGGARRWRR